MKKLSWTSGKLKIFDIVMTMLNSEKIRYRLRKNICIYNEIS